MKKMTKLLALLLALTMLFGACFAEEAAEETAEQTEEAAEETAEQTEEDAEETAQQEENEPAERVVLMTLGGEPVYQDDVEYYSNLTYMYYSYGYLDYYYDYLDSLQYVLYYGVAPKLLLTDEDVERILGDSYDTLFADYGTEFDGYVAQQIETIKSAEGYSGTDEEAEQEALQYFLDGGYTRELFIRERLLDDAYRAYLADYEVEIDDEAVMERFLELAEQDRAAYENNIADFDRNVNYMGQESYYVPEGYRGILHILIEADEALLSAYADAEEGEAKAAAAQAVIASVQDTLDEIYGAFEAGTPFEELIGKYNVDPGMTDEETLAKGYLVHKDGILFMPEFTQGSFSEGMDAPGDISAPVVTSYGVHILYYLRDVPSGVVEFTEEIAQSLTADMKNEMVYNDIVEKLRQFEVVYFPAYDESIGEPNFLDK